MREVYPRGSTSRPQFLQMKPLSFFVNLLFSIDYLLYDFSSLRQNKYIKSQGGSMKKVFGILLLSCICILLGLSVRWGRDRGLSLVDPTYKLEKRVNMQ